MLDQFTVAFYSGPLAVGLSPDSRGYVLFTLAVTDRQGNWQKTSIERLTCEHLVDLVEVTVEAMRWIAANCEEIKYEKRHLYFQFRGEK
jgi:hypothetical protein